MHYTDTVCNRARGVKDGKIKNVKKNPENLKDSYTVLVIDETFKFI